MAKGKSSKQVSFKKPPRLLYGAAFLFLNVWYRLRYGVTVDRSGIQDLKGPALVLAPHTSNKDHFLVGMALYPHRPTFVLSEHFMAIKSLRPILKILHVISKKMFTPDVSTIMNILRARRAGNVIILFPEGRLTWYGRSLPVTEGTADLVKKLGIPVYTVTANGAHLTFPKWAKAKRRGKIRIETAKLFAPEELKALTVAEIEARIAETLRHDEEIAMAGTAYRCKDTTAGLDGILYRCPVCRAEKKITAGGGHVRCEDCGFDAVLDETYRFQGAPFSGINDWYDWQAGEMDTGATVIESEVTLGTTDSEGYMQKNAGSARLRYDREAFVLDGTLMGAEFHCRIPSDKITALPLTVGEHFDVYYEGKLLYVYPADGRDVIRCVTLCDKLRKEREASARDGGDE